MPGLHKVLQGIVKFRQTARKEMVVAAVEKMLIDCHVPLIIVPLSSGISSFTLSMWPPLAVRSLGYS
ncbi:hypothetical protein Y032_0004g2179 [Ancylostoma ceylanicum]|uniref:Uncharacterized protein n=1 Tax=Ancylostoma ceylanicum TaxID=53326 RepID=A0A016VWV3_9BILA|nr:hypothetical protein Y032_0004g2179 [Ancylostoma ceylanicum]